jgi:hypothetical protein
MVKWNGFLEVTDSWSVEMISIESSSSKYNRTYSQIQLEPINYVTICQSKIAVFGLRILILINFH